MTNSNRIKLTWISFLSYALTGALVIVTGMVMGNIADYFNLPVSSMSNTFTFLNAGILISIFLNAWLMVYVAIFILTFGCEFPALGKHAPKTDAPVEKEKWGIGVLFLSVAALCYILGQLGFISWVPEYAKGLGMSLNDAGTLVSNFWMSYMVGMWAFSFILRFFDLQRILTVLAGLAAILMYVFNTGTPAHMAWSILALGFFSSAIYTTIITLGSQQTKVPSPKLVNFVLTCGTIGTMLTFVVTGPIVEHSGPQAALLTANGLYAVVFVMCFLLGFVSRHRQHNTLTSH
ncbi:MFS transporter TsgA [Escherichia coli]